MGAKTVALLLFGVFISYAVARNLPSYIKPCRKNDDKCALESTKAAVPHFINGDKEYKVPQLNPLLVEKIEVHQKDLNLKMTDIKCYFLENAEFKHVKFDLENLKFSVTFHSPICTLLSDYEIDGKILVLPISGAGKSNITLVDMVLQIDHDCALETRADGKKYVTFVNGAHETKNITRAYFDLQNLFNGDKTLSNATLEVMNESWKEMYDEFAPPVLDAFVEQQRITLNNVAGVVPYDELFIE